MIEIKIKNSRDESIIHKLQILDNIPDPTLALLINNRTQHLHIVAWLAQIFPYLNSLHFVQDRKSCHFPTALVVELEIGFVEQSEILVGFVVVSERQGCLGLEVAGG